MQLNASEISNLIEQRIGDLQVETQARTEGTIVSLTDGIVRVHGLGEVMQGEMLELPGNTFGMAMNLERDSVGVVVLGGFSTLKKVTPCVAPGEFWKFQSVRNCWGGWLTRLVSPLMARALSNVRLPRRWKKSRRVLLVVNR